MEKDRQKHKDQIDNMKLILIPMCLLIMLPLSAQEQSREQVLITDIDQLGKRAVRDMVINEEERKGIISFIQDSLPESKGLKIRALEQIRDELDEQYAEMVRRSMRQLEESGYISGQMLPDILDEPEDYISPQERNQASKMKAMANSKADMKELMKYVKPLPMKPWLMTTLRMLFGRNVSQRPARWDQIVVPQMGGVYDIILPGRRPDDRRDDMPKMEYNPQDYY